MGAHPAAAQALLVRTLLAQLFLNRKTPRLFRFNGLQTAARLVLQFELFRTCTQMALPAAGNRLQPQQGPLTAPVNPGAHQCHLDIEGIEQGVTVMHVVASVVPPELAALPQQTVVAADQICVDRLELEHDPVKPLPPQSRFPSYQVQIEGAEANAAKRADQIKLPLQRLAVSACLTSATSAEFQFQQVSTIETGPQQSPGGVPLDQVAVLTAAMGAQAAQQLHRFEQV